ncbi:MAG TPA: PP2C family serine/threonine-protein phosphatase [Pyrinomonadaceae bacterium]|nr:PP2C family serine/threonine-protein phosphatase [Pyrinomonadaceae bacterium]
MTEAANQQVNVETAAVSDRGLSEKRPLNEDSFYSDPSRHIFAVADGVGGANAGEVASQTAIEVLSEAFRHNLDDADIEDLMELAIQRANASIHQMAKEQPKFSMMATTVVALHLDGHRAIIGHVGDSRLYRLTPDGKLHRETEDHSVVEEEVRAGRMTPAQAATHPSRNVISRALGAEDGVEVDMKTIEIEDGTTFLLCSDGITRHIPDNELRELLGGRQALKDICAEMKRRCYERGAEDNLTALLVRVGADANGGLLEEFDDEGTVMAARPGLDRTMPGAAATPFAETDAAPPTDVPAPAPSDAGPVTRGVDRLMDANQMPERPVAPVVPVVSEQSVGKNVAPAQSGGGIAGTLLRLVLFLIAITIAGGAAFFYGKSYQRQIDLEKAAAAVVPAPTPLPEDPATRFDKQRREVDRDPRGALNRMVAESNSKPLDSTDPEFLYLYGRALMLSGKHTEANEAFLKSLEQLKDRPARDPLRVEAQISSIAAAFKANNGVALRTAAAELDKLIQTEDAGVAQPNVSAPVPTESSSPNTNATTLPTP